MKNLKTAAIILTAVTMVNIAFTGVNAASAAAFKARWVQRNGKWYLYDKKTGVLQKGWKEVKGIRYYLDKKTGAMKTGWAQIGSYWYYFDDSGAMQTGWQKIKKKWYYLKSSGKMVTGWYQTGGNWYYFSSSGARQKGWLKSGKKWYYLDKNGVMATGLKWIGKDLCYFNKSTGSLRSGDKPETDDSLTVHINIPTISQNDKGYPLGCEGVSLYMALRGLGHANKYDIDQFMATMPKGETPYEGYMGDPSKGRGGVNEGKRTSIYPEPLTKWAAGFASASNLTDAPVETLIEEIKAGHVVLLYATSGWNAPSWEVYPWSITEKGEVTNNHCVCVVGVYEDGSILINDCGYHLGEYKVSAKKFKSIYEARGFAVSVY